MLVSAYPVKWYPFPDLLLCNIQLVRHVMVDGESGSHISL